MFFSLFFIIIKMEYVFYSASFCIIDKERDQKKKEKKEDFLELIIILKKSLQQNPTGQHLIFMKKETDGMICFISL